MTVEEQTVATTLKYKATTSRNGYRRIDLCLLQMGQLYNAVIDHRHSATGSHHRRWSLKLQNAHLTDLHRNNPEFNVYSRRLLQSTVKRANLAYSRFFQVANAGRPRTKSPYQFSTLEISEPDVAHLKVSQDGKTSYVHVKGLPKLTFRTDKRLPDDRQPRVIRIIRTTRRLNVSLVFNVPSPASIGTATHSVGIDPGVKQMLTPVDDQGEVLQVPGLKDSDHRKVMRRLRRKTQRQRDSALKEGRARFVSQHNRNGTTRRRFRWTEGPSRAYIKTLAQLRKVEQKRQDSLSGLQHRITSQLVRNHQVIFLEDTHTRNMVRSAKGTVENPGSNVRQKAGRNRFILFQGWYSIRLKLEYKCRWYGRNFVAVPAPNTSRSCSQCGSIHAGNRRSQRRFECRDCGYLTNADVNAAENIRRQGEALARAGNKPGRAAGSPSGQQAQKAVTEARASVT